MYKNGSFGIKEVLLINYNKQKERDITERFRDLSVRSFRNYNND